MAVVVAASAVLWRTVAEDLAGAIREGCPFFVFFDSGDLTGAIGGDGETMADVLRVAEAACGVGPGELVAGWVD